MSINQSKTQIKKQSPVFFLLPLLILLFVILLTGCTMPLSAIRSEAFSGKIVDKKTGQPIEGAIVVMKWPRRAGNFVAAHTLGIVDIQEVLSDKNGVYHIEGWKKYQKDIGKGGFTTSRPRMYIYKSGYWALELTNDIRKNRALELFEAWKSDWDGKTIELEPMHSEKWKRKEWKRYAYFVEKLRMARALGDCGWMVTANMLLEISRLEETFVEHLGVNGGPFTYHAKTILTTHYERDKKNCSVEPYDYFIKLGLSKEKAQSYWALYKKRNTLSSAHKPDVLKNKAPIENTLNNNEIKE